MNVSRQAFKLLDLLETLVLGPNLNGCVSQQSHQQEMFVYPIFEEISCVV